MGKVISNDMHWFWKVSLVCCSLWALFTWGGSGVDVDEWEMLVMWYPLSIWLMGRWSVVKGDE